MIKNIRFDVFCLTSAFRIKISGLKSTFGLKSQSKIWRGKIEYINAQQKRPEVSQLTHENERNFKCQRAQPS